MRVATGLILSVLPLVGFACTGEDTQGDGHAPGAGGGLGGGAGSGGTGGGSGRAFYTELGHTRESYAEPNFLAHVAGAIEWAAGRD